MLEQKIEALTTAVEALTAILTSQGGAAAAAPAAATAAKTEDKAPAAADKPKRTTKAAAADKPKRTKAEVQAAVNEVKENFDVATAKGLIKAAGFLYGDDYASHLRRSKEQQLKSSRPAA